MVLFVVLWCQSALCSPIGEVNLLSISKSVSDTNSNSVYDGNDGYKQDEAFKVGSSVCLT